MSQLQYKGYIGSIEASIKDNVLFGKLQYISALINYEGNTVEELKAMFEEAVDDYLAYCKEKGYTPEQPCKGSFNVRLGHKLHLAAAQKAKASGVSLNDLVKQSVSQQVI